jgi:predicted nucleic acid-binding protein
MRLLFDTNVVLDVILNRQPFREASKDAADSPVADFEDAVLLEAGVAFGVDAVVTRDPEDFQKGRLPVYSPWQFHQTLGSAEH